MRILAEGTRLAERYTLIRRLGTGGMAETWLAADRRSDTRIVLKFAMTPDPGSGRQWLEREWRIGSRLMHPDIVRIFEFHDDPDGAFFGMQYVGDTSFAVLAGAPPADSLRPLALIADALRYAHGKGVVHRDIKASNVLIDSGGVPCLVDFGVADTAGGRTMRGSGSPVAASPEQRSGHGASPADDIFALGVLMHELLTGMPTAAGIPSTLPDGSPVPEALRALLDDMLATEPTRRPDAETVAVRLAEAGYPAGPAPRRYVSGAAAATAEESVDTIARYRRREARTTPEPVVRQGSGISARALYGGLGAAVVILLAVVFVLPRAVNRDARTGAESEVTESPQENPGEEPAAAEAADSAGTAPAEAAPGNAAFSENLTSSGGIKAQTDEALGDLLSQLERLRYRAIDRWGGQDYLDAVDIYKEGDRAYIDRNYRLAGEKYRQASKMLAPFFDRIDAVFGETLAAAKAAFEAQDPSEAVRLYSLAVAITPGNRIAEAGLVRAGNLEAVLSLVEQGRQFEDTLELDAARTAYENALELDSQWQPASEGLARVKDAINRRSFEQRMTEGFDALAAGAFESARAAFNAAKDLDPGSNQPADGLLQLDQAIRLHEIGRLEDQVRALEKEEQWETAVGVYEQILKIDPDLDFARQGLRDARVRSSLHAKLQGYIADPDSLSDDVVMQNATQLLLDVGRMPDRGPRLEDQKNELSRLLKRAATPLPVTLVSDNQTNVVVYKVGRFGRFERHSLSLRPGNYVAVGNRVGFRDVRVEFRVAPEVELGPVVVQCEEPI